jgi:Ion transport protein
VLLLLLIFIYVLLGMELFAQRKGQVQTDTALIDYPRYNFNDITSGAIVIFTLLTGENWDQTMFQFAHTEGANNGYIAIMFFISFVIIGVMIFLNLFLAILLENF